MCDILLLLTYPLDLQGILATVNGVNTVIVVGVVADGVGVADVVGIGVVAAVAVVSCRPTGLLKVFTHLTIMEAELLHTLYIELREPP